MLERWERAGGAATSEPVWPGYTVSAASYVCSLLDPQVVADLDLRAHGYDAYVKDPSSFTPLLDGRSLLLSRDAQANEREVAAFDPNDVAGLDDFDRLAATLGAKLFDTFADDEPDFTRFDAPTQDMLRGSVADIVERHVRTPVLQATLATDGLIGTFAGPRDPGTGYVFAHHYAGRALGVQGAWGFVRGGMGAISQAIERAFIAAGGTLRTAAHVSKIDVAGGRARRVVLDDGEAIEARAILSNAHPATTFGELLPAATLDPAFRARLDAWRTEGVSLKLNLALGELPNFTCRPGTDLQPHHRATIHVASSIDYLQAAADDAWSGRVSAAPMLECFMQTPTDPTLAPPGKHILSVFAQYYPYHRADGPWTAAKAGKAADDIIALLAAYAPNLPSAIEARQVLSPADLELRFGLIGGHIFHGELLPGQIYEHRFAVRTPVDGLYLCGSGTHPGGCVSGFPGRRAARAAITDLTAALERRSSS